MTDRQRTFLDAYLADPQRNATRAAASAGFAWPDKQGARLKTFPGVAEAIRADDERRKRQWQEDFERQLVERRAEERRERRRELRSWHAANPWYRAGISPPPLPASVLRRRAKLWRRCM